jgi:cobalamin synthase
MSYRRSATKPTAALWLLVAVADAVLVLASAGVLVLISLLSLAILTAAGAVVWRHLGGQAGGTGASAPIPVRVPSRHR